MNTNFVLAQESKQPSNKVDEKNFTTCDLGEFNKIKEYAMENKDLNLKSCGKIFLHDLLSLSGSEISINSIPAGTKAPFKHLH